MRVRSVSVAVACAAAVTFVSTAVADPLGRTTVQQTIEGGKRPGFSFLRSGPGEPYRVRSDLNAKPREGRVARRRSLTYFAQLTDFQIADEESPARVEPTDNFNSFFHSAWRPQEALAPHMIDAQIRQVNAHSRSSLRSAGRRAKLAYAVMTGDNADSQQLNETDWINTLLTGGRLDPNSGSPNHDDYAGCPSGTPGTDEAARYTGIQDFDDFGPNGDFYDPESPIGLFEGWPVYPGLMDRAQQPFLATGLKVPVYTAFGNHDALVQGNEDANADFERIALGCEKAMRGSTPDSTDTLLPYFIAPDQSQVMLVPPDPRRRYLSKPQYIERFKDAPEGSGFVHIEPAEREASRGAAGYYAFSPAPGFRFIALDTVSEAGVPACSSDGNIDAPQWRWLEAKLAAASRADELVVVFGHHSIQSLLCSAPDESASQCTADDTHGHDVNPGCDLDPRDSRPVRVGTDLTKLLKRHRHVIAFIAGHSHINDVLAFGSFWNIRTSAEADWPHQQRLVEVMDNHDGTLSIFGTVIDLGAPVAAPPAGTPASQMSLEDLAALGRVLGYNDPHKGGGTGEGERRDRNVEMLLRDPRRAPGAFGAGADSRRRLLRLRFKPKALQAGKPNRVVVRVQAGGRAVRGAKVRVGGRTLRSNRKGLVRLRVTPRRARPVKVTATSPGLRTARKSIQVRR